MLSATAPIIAIAGMEVALLAGGAIAIAAIVGGAVLWRRRRDRSAPAERPIHRPPSPASVGLDDDPIVAALVGRAAEEASRRSPVRLPGDRDPQT